MHVRNHELIDIKIRQYLLPAVMMKLALQLGNIVDTILVGNLLGTTAMSAVSLSIPILSFIQIPGYFLGNGGAIAAGILLGKRQRKEAGGVFTATFLITLLSGMIFLAASFVATDPIAHLLSGGGELEPFVAQYVFVCLAGSPILGTGILLACYFANDSHPQLASAYYITSNAVNLVFDYIFLKYTPLGVAGAALSTMLGFLVGFVIAIPYARSKKRMITFVKPKGDPEMAKKVAETGMPFLSYLVVVMIKGFLMNSIVLTLLGEMGMVVYTVCSNTQLILAMLIGGVIGVIPNFAGILYGEKDYYGIHALCKKVFQYAYVITGVLMIAVFVFAKTFALIFGVDEPVLQAIVASVLRIYVFSMPFNAWNFFGMQYYGSVEKSSLATLITTLQNGLFLIPAALIGIILGQNIGGSGYMGLGIAFVLSESLTTLAANIYRIQKFKGESMLLIPEKNPGVNMDFSMPAKDEELPKVPRELKEFCIKHGVDKQKANLIAVAAEEMVRNIIDYGGRKSKWIDVCLTVEDDQLLLRIRDNGEPFDPTTYEFDDTDFDIHGIELAKSVATEISYIRAIDLNNTIVALQL